MSWRVFTFAFPVPFLLFAGHLVGGASSPVAAAVLTAGIAMVTGWSLLTVKNGLTRDYRNPLIVPAAAALALGLYIVLTLVPGTAILASGRLAETVGGSTLSLDPGSTVVELLKLGGLAAAFLAACVHGADRVRLKAVLVLMVWFTTAWAIWSLGLLGSEIGQGDLVRLSGPFVSPNVAGAYLGVGLLCCQALFTGFASSGHRRGLSQLPAAGSALLLTAALILTASRSAVGIVLVLVAVSAAASLLARRARPNGPSLRVASIAAVLVGLAGIAVLTSSAFIDRLTRLQTDAHDRWTIVKAYVEVALQSPLFGQGFGTVPRISRTLLTPENNQALWNVRAVHNLPVQWWTEGGLVGLVLGGIILFAVLAKTVTRLRRTDRRRLMPLLAVSALLLLQGLVDYAAQVYSLALTWAFVAGLTYAASARSHRGKRRMRRLPIVAYLAKSEPTR